MAKKSTDFSVISLFQDATKTTIALIVGFIFSTALIGGGAYFYLEAPIEIATIQSNVAETSQQYMEEENVTSMLEVFNNGWHANQNLQAEANTVLTTIIKARADGTLDKSFVASSGRWYVDVTSAIAEENGKISGYVFNTEAYKQSQAGLLKFNDAWLQTFQGVNALIQNWENSTPDDRSKQLQVISDQMTEIINSGSAAQTQWKLSLQQAGAKRDQINSHSNQLQAQLDVFYTRVQLSVIGMLLGSVMLLTFAVVSITLYRNSRKKSSKAAKRQGQLSSRKGRNS